MKKITKQNQVQEFLDNLTDEEFDIIYGCYENPHFIDFDDLLEWGIRENPPGFKDDIPTVKRLAVFESTYKVKLFELLDIPGIVYQGQTKFICESLLLPVDEKDNGDVIEISLNKNEQMSLHFRDSEFRGAWTRMEENADNSSNDKFKAKKFKEFLAIDKLRKLEQKHKVNLGVLMRQYVPLEPENNRKEEIKNG